LKSYGIFLGMIVTLAFVLGGAMFVVYGFFPHQYYLPTSLALTAAAGIIVYVILARVVQL
jgi:hypothetical protein